MSVKSRPSSSTRFPLDTNPYLWTNEADPNGNLVDEEGRDFTDMLRTIQMWSKATPEQRPTAHGHKVFLPPDGEGWAEPGESRHHSTYLLLMETCGCEVISEEERMGECSRVYLNCQIN